MFVCVCVCVCVYADKVGEGEGSPEIRKEYLRDTCVFLLSSDARQRAETHCFQCHQPKDIGMRGLDRGG